MRHITHSTFNVIITFHLTMQGPPVREPGMNEEERKHLMLMEHRRREEIKRLLQDEDDNYLNQVKIVQVPRIQQRIML